VFEITPHSNVTTRQPGVGGYTNHQKPEAKGTMKCEPDRRVRVEVTHSECELMKPGDTVFLKGPIIDREHSSDVCITALLGIYPWVMAARFGIESATLEWDDGYRVWCPEKLVQFHIRPVDT
jgi:uncharacterized repeat protein (TIGR04076 family)